MNGRNQPYIDTNATGTYVPTTWVDYVEGIQDGTPIDEQNLNNLECGVNSANLLGEFLTETLYKAQKDIAAARGEKITVALTNTQGAFFNNSAKTVALTNRRDNLDYDVRVSIPADSQTNVGEVFIYDKQLNGFKVKYTGSAASVTLDLFVSGGMSA